MSRWLKGLNPQQRRAVQTLQGPLLVLAGAGSGKTRVITHRIAHLMEQRVAAENILGVTFTNKAAGEMRERLHGMVGRGAEGVTLSTFHALGVYLLRQEARRRRRAQPFTIYDAGDQLALLRDALRSVRLAQSVDLGAVLRRISHWKNLFFGPGEAPESDDPYDQAAAELYPRYQALLQARRALDFDDLIVEPCRMLERSEAARARWAERFQYVLVDEYQDTNPAQLRLLRALGADHGNVCVVGDDDQAIYGWRGADVRNILQFERDFPGAQVIRLTRNYRSTSRILDAANQVIAQNPRRHPKKLQAERGEGARVQLTVLATGEAEAAWVGRTLRERLDTGRYRLRDMAVLYRSNALARELETELRVSRVDYRLLGGTSFYDRKEVKDLTAYLRLCLNPRDELSLRRIINSPPRGIGTGSVEKLSAWAEAHGRSLYDALGQADQVLGGSPPARRVVQAVAGFTEVVERHRGRLRQGRALGQAVRGLLDDVGLEEDLRRSATSPEAAQHRLGDIAGFLEGVERYARRAARPSLTEHLSQLALLGREHDGEEGSDDRVTLSTLHGAKGLEFPLVILVGLEEGLLPHDRTLNPQVTDLTGGDLSEERRLLYVGMTRAMDQLILTRAKTRTVRGKPAERAPSRFLGALPTEELDLEDRSAVATAEDVSEILGDLKNRLGW